MTRSQFINDLDRCQQILDAIGAEAERIQHAQADAQWEARWQRHKSRGVAPATPAPAPTPAPDHQPSYDEIKRAARAPRPPYVASVISPYVFSPGSNIRSR